MKKAYIGGTFDRFHVGHINLIEYVKKMGFKPLVVINSDSFINSYKPNKGIENEQTRLTNALKYCDLCYLVDKDNQYSKMEELLSDGDVIVVGTDWLKPEILPQLQLDESRLRQHNWGLLIVPRTPDISSTLLRSKK